MIWSAAVIIPFRDRGIDPLRQANLECVRQHWERGAYVPLIVSDGRDGDQQFNRSAAYNLGVAMAPRAQVYIFAESDMLIDLRQLQEAIELAAQAPGLVVPFTEYRYLSQSGSAAIRELETKPHDIAPEWVMSNGRSIGAINVVSAATMAMVGRFDEAFEGNWYDDDAMKRAFEIAAGPTRWVDGPAFHLFHLPGWKGPHLTAADRAATARNKQRLGLYQDAASAARIRELTAGATR